MESRAIGESWCFQNKKRVDDQRKPNSQRQRECTMEGCMMEIYNTGTRVHRVYSPSVHAIALCQHFKKRFSKSLGIIV
jgi:hypothetical protein